MANSGIKMNEAALALATQMKAKEIKGFFLVVNKDANLVIPDGSDPTMPLGKDVMEELASRFVDGVAKYGVVSFEVQLEESDRKTDYIFFISWVPDDCKVKPKMVASSTLDSVYNKVGQSVASMIKVTINSREDLTMSHLLDNRKCGDNIRVFDGKKIKGKKGSYKYVSDCH